MHHRQRANHAEGGLWSHDSWCPRFRRNLGFINLSTASTPLLPLLSLVLYGTVLSNTLKQANLGFHILLRGFRAASSTSQMNSFPHSYCHLLSLSFLFHKPRSAQCIYISEHPRKHVSTSCTHDYRGVEVRDPAFELCFDFLCGGLSGSVMPLFLFRSR